MLVRRVLLVLFILDVLFMDLALFSQLHRKRFVCSWNQLITLKLTVLVDTIADIPATVHRKTHWGCIGRTQRGKKVQPWTHQGWGKYLLPEFSHANKTEIKSPFYNKGYWFNFQTILFPGISLILSHPGAFNKNGWAAFSQNKICDEKMRT